MSRRTDRQNDRPRGANPRLGRRARWLLLAVVVIGSLTAYLLFSGGGDDAEAFTLDQFETAVADGEVATATIRDRSHTIRGELEDGTTY